MIGRRQTSDDERVPRKDRTGASPFLVGLLVLVVACIGVFFGFTKHIPFTHGFRVQAVFQSANSIRKNSPVRIAGVNVGKVTKIEGKPGSDAAVAAGSRSPIRTKSTSCAISSSVQVMGWRILGSSRSSPGVIGPLRDRRSEATPASRGS